MADGDQSEIDAPPTRCGDDEPGTTSPEPETATHGPTSVEIGPGTLLFGRHWVIRKLGAGGMGDVWLVRVESLGCERALKLIVSGIAADPSARARFRAEARTMAGISHPNIVVFHDARPGRDRDDIGYIEMEHVRGQGLDRLLAPGSALPLDLAARLIRQLCDALDAVHSRGIVHRDLKPSNLMLLEGRPPGREWLKVLDFGIAKTLLADGGEGTITRGFVGSYPYAAPEQIEGHAEIASDLYSVGVILFQMLTGARPFTGPMTKVILDHLHTPPPTFAAVRPDLALPPAIEAVVRRCLAKKPGDRPRSASELADSLEAALRADPPSTVVHLSGSIAPSTRAARRPRLPVPLLFVSALAAVLMAIVILKTPRAVGPSTPAPLVAIPGPPDRDDPAPTPAAVPVVEVAPTPTPVPAETAPKTIETPQPPAPIVASKPEPKAPVAPIPAPTRPAPAPPRQSLAVATIDRKIQTVASNPVSPPGPPRASARNPGGLPMILVRPAGQRPFYLDAHETRQRVYESVMGRNPSVLATSGDHPVTNVNWYGALRFCNALSVLEKRRPYYKISGKSAAILGGDGYRLPTAAEWEWACHSSGSVLFSFGDDFKSLGQHAWYRDNSAGDPDDPTDGPAAHAVGGRAPSPSGFHDLHGNVAEWCWDPFSPTDARRVTKGGCFNDPPQLLRIAIRGAESPDVGDYAIGIRVARDVSATDLVPASARVSAGEIGR